MAKQAVPKEKGLLVLGQFLWVSQELTAFNQVGGLKQRIHLNLLQVSPVQLGKENWWTLRMQSGCGRGQLFVLESNLLVNNNFPNLLSKLIVSKSPEMWNRALAFLKAPRDMSVKRACSQ
jgi:hypothetical protein